MFSKLPNQFWNLFLTEWQWDNSKTDLVQMTNETNSTKLKFILISQYSLRYRLKRLKTETIHLRLCKSSNVAPWIYIKLHKVFLPIMGGLCLFDLHCLWDVRILSLKETPIAAATASWSMIPLKLNKVIVYKSCSEVSTV